MQKHTLCLDRKIQQHKDTTSENKIKEINQNTTLYIEIGMVVYIFQDSSNIFKIYAFYHI